jgi:tetratricopeptide (TPR) repeat protein
VKLKLAAHDDAVALFLRALALDAKHAHALGNVAAAFASVSQPGKAKPFLDRLLRVTPFSAQTHLKAANNSLKLGHVDQAIYSARKAVRISPSFSSARLSLGEALEAGGRFKQAKFQYLSVLRREPHHLGALSRLLTLPGSVSGQYVNNAEANVAREDLVDRDRVQLLLGLARHYDRCGSYERAFGYVEQANKIRFANHPFDRVLHSEAVDRMIEVFTPGCFASIPRHETITRRPVFIVGMPRSGTTLVEQILASHSRISSGGELPAIVGIAMQIGQGKGSYPEGVRQLDGPALAGLAAEYLDKLRSISMDSDRVTDKMPFNYMHLGLIHALFPNAKIIHCRRDPLDTCLSCFMTTFSESLQFASDQTTLGQYYLDYRRLMAHWRSVLMEPWLDVQYERLVDDPEGVIRQVLQYCELDWESSCLRFHRTDRGVLTPSRWQVRQPIYRHSVGRWHHYERQLQPLVDVLNHGLRSESRP